MPFLNKRYITIPKATEATYFEKFVAPLIEKYHVYAEGFEINTEKHEAIPIIKVIYVDGGISQIQLYFKYGQYAFAMGNESKVTVRLSKDEDNYINVEIKKVTPKQQEHKTEAQLMENKCKFMNSEIAKIEKKHRQS